MLRTQLIRSGVCSRDTDDDWGTCMALPFRRLQPAVGTVTALAQCALSTFLPLVLAGCISVNAFKPSRTLEGLQLAQHKQVDVVYTAPMTLAAYESVILDPVDVGFKRDWKRSNPQLTEADIQRMRADVAALFRQVFARELDERGGYHLTETLAAHVLRVGASIVDLDVAATAASADHHAHQISAPDVTLVGELRDSVSGATPVRAADREEGRIAGDLQVQKDMNGSAQAAQLFGARARVMREALDAAREAPLPAG